MPPWHPLLQESLAPRIQGEAANKPRAQGSWSN